MNLCKLHFLGTIMFFMMYSLTFSQDTCSYRLYGNVIDEHDGQALGYASIYIQELEKGTVSDSSGKYEMENICPGDYTIECRHVGCEILVMQVSIRKDLKLNFYPEHHRELLSAFQITVEKPEEESMVSKQSLSPKDLEETSGQSLGQSLKKISGVNSLNTGNNISKPVIHGLHSNRILILNNGVRLEGQQWGSEHAPEIDPFIAADISVSKGAQSIQYGPDAIGGVVLVNPSIPPPDPFLKGSLDLVGFSNGRMGVMSGSIQGRLRKIKALSWGVQGTLKQGGNVKSPDYYLKNTGMKEYDFSWNASYEKSKYGFGLFYNQYNADLGIFSASHIGNLTDLERAFEAEEPLESADFTYEIDRPFQKIQHELFKASSFIRTGDVGKLNVVYARQYNKRREYDRHGFSTDDEDAADLHLELTTHTVDVNWEHFRKKNFIGKVGVSGLFQENTYEGRYFIPNYTKTGGGIFILERWKPLHSKFELEAGLRFDHIDQKVYLWENDVLETPEFRYDNFSGSLGGIYKFNQALLFKLNLGSAWRPPYVNEMFSNGLHHGAAAVEIGDTNLVKEVAYNLNVGAEYRGHRWTAQLDVYNYSFDNFIYLKPVQPPTLTIRGAFPTFAYSQTKATLSGFDFTFTYRLFENLHFRSTSSMLWAINRSEDEYLVQMPPDRFENELKYLFNLRKVRQKPFVSFSVLHVPKQWKVPPNSDYVAPPEGYTLLNAQIGFYLPVKNQEVSIGLGIENLLNTRYRDYMNRFRYYADEMGRNVSLRIKIPFAVFDDGVPRIELLNDEPLNN